MIEHATTTLKEVHSQQKEVKSHTKKAAKVLATADRALTELESSYSTLSSMAIQSLAAAKQMRVDQILNATEVQ